MVKQKCLQCGCHCFTCHAGATVRCMTWALGQSPAFRTLPPRFSHSVSPASQGTILEKSKCFLKRRHWGPLLRDSWQSHSQCFTGSGASPDESYFPAVCHSDWSQLLALFSTSFSSDFFFSEIHKSSLSCEASLWYFIKCFLKASAENITCVLDFPLSAISLVMESIF